MQKPNIESKIETITPELAEQYLAQNSKNRHVRDRIVRAMASEMASGKFMLTHQGIAFDTGGRLVDGQHRLRACVLAKTPFTTMVTRGLPVKMTKDSISICTMDVVDRGAGRTIGDQLNLQHGFSNGTKVAGAANIIAKICSDKFGGIYMTVPMTLSILRFYADEIQYCCENGSPIPGLRSCSVLGAFAFVMHGQASTKEFHTQVVEGENLKKGMPAYAVRHYLLNSAGNGGGGATMGRTLAVLNAARAFVCNESLTKIYHLSRTGLDFWLDTQKDHVSKIRTVIRPIEDEDKELPSPSTT